MEENQPAFGREPMESMDPTDYESVFAAVHRLRRECPALQTFTIGRSVLGRGVTALMLGAGRPHALFVAGVRAGDGAAAGALLHAAQELCRSLAADGRLRGMDVRELLARGSAYFVPLLNPDGTEIRLKGPGAAGALRESVRRLAGGNFAAWQANARGVDLARNCNADFERVIGEEIARQKVGPAPEGFSGIRPESEPEIHALCNLCRRIPFRRAVCFHTGDRRLGWYYGARTPKNTAVAALQLAQACGCTPQEKEEAWEPGSFPAWFTRVFARPVFDAGLGDPGREPEAAPDGREEEGGETLDERVLETVLEGLAL